MTMARTTVDDGFKLAKGLSCVEVGERYGLRPDRSGFCVCPFHAGDDHGSLKLYGPAKGFYCYGCHRGGSTVDLAMQLLHLETPLDALRVLNDDFHLGIEFDRPLTAKERAEARRRRRESERSRQLAESFDRWRRETLDILTELLQTVNTLDHEPTSPREIALVRGEARLENWCNILLNDDAGEITDLFTHRGEMTNICDGLKTYSPRVQS